VGKRHVYPCAILKNRASGLAAVGRIGPDIDKVDSGHHFPHALIMLIHKMK